MTDISIYSFVKSVLSEKPLCSPVAKKHTLCSI